MVRRAFRREEVAGAALACATALIAPSLVSQFGPDYWMTREASLALVPCGLVAGLAALGRRDRSPAPAATAGAKAGALSGALFVLATVAVGAVRLAPAVGARAVDWSLFTAFAFSVVILPLYTVEGALAGPVVGRLARSVGGGAPPGRDYRWR